MPPVPPWFLCLCFMHAVTQFHFRNVNTVSAESVGGSTPGVRVTWNTTVPPECVASVMVEFRPSSRGPVVATYTTTNTSQTEVIQRGSTVLTTITLGDDVHIATNITYLHFMQLSFAPPLLL